MKSFVVSSCIILSIFVATVLNSVFVSKATDELIRNAKEIQFSEESVEEFSQLWEKRQFLIRISSSHKETHRINEAVVVLKEKTKNNTRENFDEERALIIEYLIQIKDDETVSLDSII